MILYINHEYCSSVEQLKGYFSASLTPESDTYSDLLDYGRYGDIAVWLREKGEPELASRVESIPEGLSDSAYFAQLKSAVTGLNVPDGESLRPAFGKCFSYEGVECDVSDKEAKVSVQLKVLMCVNEEYELTVSSNWEPCSEMVNPYNYTEGKSVSIGFVLHKIPGKEIGDIKVKADGEELTSMDTLFCGDVDEISVGNVRFKMIRVDGGTFTMGATPEMKYPNDNEKHAHQVYLSSYHIGETPVTQALWEVVMGNNPSYFKGDNLPVEQVSWNDCQEFIRELNAKTGKNFRLPTEAEWEFAARGGIKSNHTQYSGSEKIDDVAWYGGNSGSKTHPVKTKNPNELGIYDMSGNVWEWCQDWFGDYKGGSQTNPTGSASGSFCVFRGGSWNNVDWICRLSCRIIYSPDFAGRILGLRLALSE